MEETIISKTPYDDVFRTLINDCKKLIIPVINEVFHEDYTGDELIQLTPNEHFLNQQDGGEIKRITDSSFEIIGTTTKKYHLECQSTIDYSILIRIFEYDAQIALDQDSEVLGNKIIVSFPNTAVLFLRSTKTTPDIMEIIIRTPGGEVSYDVPVMKVIRYTIQEIFDKNLLFLIPFYIFTYENSFAEIDRNEEKLEMMKAEFQMIRDRLGQMVEEESIDEFYRQTILDMSERVIMNLAEKYGNISRGVGSVMGGQIIETEAKKILNAGIEQGIEQGIEKGIEQGIEKGIETGMFNTLIDLVEKGLLQVRDAAAQAGVSEEAFLQRMTKAKI